MFLSHYTVFFICFVLISLTTGPNCREHFPQAKNDVLKIKERQRKEKSSIAQG